MRIYDLKIAPSVFFQVGILLFALNALVRRKFTPKPKTEATIQQFLKRGILGCN
jgi:hypothetical protein